MLRLLSGSAEDKHGFSVINKGDALPSPSLGLNFPHTSPALTSARLCCDNDKKQRYVFRLQFSCIRLSRFFPVTDSTASRLWSFVFSGGLIESGPGQLIFGRLFLTGQRKLFLFVNEASIRAAPAKKYRKKSQFSRFYRAIKGIFL